MNTQTASGCTESDTVDTATGGGKVLPASAWQRLGFAGFVFFLVKGLLWVAVPAVFVLLD